MLTIAPKWREHVGSLCYNPARSHPKRSTRQLQTRTRHLQMGAVQRSTTMALLDDRSWLEDEDIRARQQDDDAPEDDDEDEDDGDLDDDDLEDDDDFDDDDEDDDDFDDDDDEEEDEEDED